MLFLKEITVQYTTQNITEMIFMKSDFNSSNNNLQYRHRRTDASDVINSDGHYLYHHLDNLSDLKIAERQQTDENELRRCSFARHLHLYRIIRNILLLILIPVLFIAIFANSIDWWLTTLILFFYLLLISVLIYGGNQYNNFIIAEIKSAALHDNNNKIVSRTAVIPITELKLDENNSNESPLPQSLLLLLNLKSVPVKDGWLKIDEHFNLNLKSDSGLQYDLSDANNRIYVFHCSIDEIDSSNPLQLNLISVKANWRKDRRLTDFAENKIRKMRMDKFLLVKINKSDFKSDKWIKIKK